MDKHAGVTRRSALGCTAVAGLAMLGAPIGASAEALQDAEASHNALLHPERRPLVAGLREMARPMRRPTLAGLDAARRAMQAPAPLETPAWSERIVPGRRGPDVRVLVVNPRPHAEAPRRGVATELHLVPGAFHAFDVVAPAARVTVQFRSQLRDALARGMARS